MLFVLHNLILLPMDPSCQWSRFLVMYTLHEDKYYGFDTCVLQGSLATEHDLAIRFCLMVLHYSSEGS